MKKKRCNVISGLKKWIKQDYSQSQITPGQEWYMGGNEWLSPEETKEYLLHEMNKYQILADDLRQLVECIRWCLKEYEMTGRLYSDALNLSEILANTEMCMEEVLKNYERLGFHESADHEEYEDHGDDDFLPY